MDDLISRQAALDELQKMYRAAEEWGRTAGNHEAGIRAESCIAGIVEMKLRIEKLPPALQKKLKYSGDSICISCQTKDCDGCLLEPMEWGMG